MLKLGEDLEKIIFPNIITGGNPVKCGYKIDGKDVYVKRISATLSGTSGNNITCGLSGLSYTPLKYELFLISGGVTMFNANTPRGTGINVDNTQLYSYWNFANDVLFIASNGFDRTGTIVKANLYFTYN